MKTQIALYIVALSLHTALIAVVLQFRIDKRHPIFFILLATSLLSNLALMALRLAREREAYARLAERSDWMWYALALAALVWALLRRGYGGQGGDPSSGTIIRGLLLMIAMTIVARWGAGLHLAGGVGPVVARACNLAYLAPTVYLILALSNVQPGRILLKIGLGGSTSTAMEASVVALQNQNQCGDKNVLVAEFCSD